MHHESPLLSCQGTGRKQKILNLFIKMAYEPKQVLGRGRFRESTFSGLYVSYLHSFGGNIVLAKVILKFWKHCEVSKTLLTSVTPEEGTYYKSLIR